MSSASQAGRAAYAHVRREELRSAVAAWCSGVFFRAAGARLYAMLVFDELARTETASDGLALLARLVEQKVLTPRVDVEAPWTEIAEVARRLIARAFVGKAVLHVSR